MGWTTLLNAVFLPGKPILGSTGAALRDNIPAAAHGEAGAPITGAGWHPYDAVDVGDGATGLIYDSAVNGSVASITTPDFEDGYEYAAHWNGLTLGNGNTLRLAVNRSVSGNVTSWTVVTGNTGETICSGVATFIRPRVVLNAHIIQTATYAHAGANAEGAASATDRGLSYATAQKLNRAIFTNSGGSITAGKMWLLRRLLPNG
jgi:hypothetical protein